MFLHVLNNSILRIPFYVWCTFKPTQIRESFSLSREAESKEKKENVALTVRYTFHISNSEGLVMRGTEMEFGCLTSKADNKFC